MTDDKKTKKKYITNPRRMAFFALGYAGATSIHKGIGFLLFMWLAYELPVKEYASFGLLYALYSGVAALSMAGVVESVIGLLVANSIPTSRKILFVAAERVFYVMAAFCISIVGLGLMLIPGTADLPWVAVLSATSAGILTALFTIRSHLIRLDENHRASLLLHFIPPVAAFIGASIVFYIFLKVIFYLFNDS
jgi:hypothetical protein